MFESTEFINNRKRAIFMASNASLALNSCYFENNGNQRENGGAIQADNNVSLSTYASSFYGTSSCHTMDSSMTLLGKPLSYVIL